MVRRRERKTETKRESIVPLLLGRRVRQRDNRPLTSFIAHSDANLSFQRLSSTVKKKKKRGGPAIKASLHILRLKLKLLDLVEHPLCFDKRGQLYADVC